MNTVKPSSRLIYSSLRIPKLAFQSVTTRSSSYGPHFVDPIFQRDELKKANESGEAARLKHIPIKAARSHETCSVFYDPLVQKFTNHVMREGKKELAEDLVRKTFELVKRNQVKSFNKEKDEGKKVEIELDAVKLFHKALENCKPVLKLVPVKKGGQTYQVPVAVDPKQAQFLAMTWLVEEGKVDSKTIKFHVKLATELINASKNQGKVVKRKQDLHKQCESNRAYAHFRWN